MPKIKHSSAGHRPINSETFLVGLPSHIIEQKIHLNFPNQKVAKTSIMHALPTYQPTKLAASCKNVSCVVIIHSYLMKEQPASHLRCVGPRNKRKSRNEKLCVGNKFSVTRWQDYYLLFGHLK